MARLDIGSVQTADVFELYRCRRAILGNECARSGIDFRDDNPVFFNVIRDFAAKSPDRRVVQAVPFEKHSARLVAGQSGHT